MKNVSHGLRVAGGLALLSTDYSTNKQQPKQHCAIPIGKPDAQSPLIITPVAAKTSVSSNMRGAHI